MGRHENTHIYGAADREMPSANTAAHKYHTRHEDRRHVRKVIQIEYNGHQTPFHIQKTGQTQTKKNAAPTALYSPTSLASSSRPPWFSGKS